MENRTLKEKRDETVRRILDAATEIFAEVGFAGARVDEIAKRARVNKATIYYRIGDKEALYGRVLHDVFADTTTRIALNIKESQDPEEKLKTYIRNIARTVDQHPHVPSIMMREFASGGGSFPKIVPKDFARIFGMLMQILEEGRKKGVFTEANPFILHLMVIGPLIFSKNIGTIRPKLRGPAALLKRLDKTFSGSIAGEIETLLLRAVKK